MAKPRAIQIKRVYEVPKAGDGFRVLVDRLWPRGIQKESAQVDHWARGLAPSTELRQWFHGGGDFQAFSQRYREELQQTAQAQALEEVLARWKQQGGMLTLLYASRDEAQNHAVLLRELLLNRV